MKRPLLNRSFRLVAVAGMLAIAGCSSSLPPTDAPQAREALVSTLESWKAGESPADLQSRTPSIVVGDYEWEAGRQLASYELLPSEIDDGANLHCPVKLVLKGQNGTNQETFTSYVVGVKPVITVIREE